MVVTAIKTKLIPKERVECEFKTAINIIQTAL